MFFHCRIWLLERNAVKNDLIFLPVTNITCSKWKQNSVKVLMKTLSGIWSWIKLNLHFFPWRSTWCDIPNIWIFLPFSPWISSSPLIKRVGSLREVSFITLYCCEMRKIFDEIWGRFVKTCVPSGLKWVFHRRYRQREIHNIDRFWPILEAKKWPKPVNVVNFPLSLPPVEKLL